MCAPEQIPKCVNDLGRKIGRKRHCAPGECDVRLSGQPGVGFIIYECRKCGCFEGL